MSKQQFIRIAGRLTANLIRLWIGTLHMHKEDINPGTNRIGLANPGSIYCFWHEDLLSLARFFGGPGIRVPMGRARNEGLAHSTIEALGFHTVCESADQRGTVAKWDDIAGPEGADLGVTSDGPRGPRRRFPARAVSLASRTGMPLVPLGLAYERLWYLEGPEEVVIPRPFSRVVVCANGPLSVTGGASRESLKMQRLKLDALMQESSLRAESLLRRWCQGEKLPLVSPEAKALESILLRKSA